MRVIAPIIRIARHAHEWYGAVRQRRAEIRQRRAEDKPVVAPYDHGKLDVSYGYWMKRIALEEANGTRKRDWEA